MFAALTMPRGSRRAGFRIYLHHMEQRPETSSPSFLQVAARHRVPPPAKRIIARTRVLFQSSKTILSKSSRWECHARCVR
jgi:hypothetical protein